MAFTAGSTEVVEGIRHHHERWDGSGYPNGLVGEEIPLFARMIAIAEAFDAMTSPRPYRRSFTRDQAVQLLKDQAGGQFDPELVALFAESMREQTAALFAPLLALPLRSARDFFASVRRLGNGGVTAVVGGATALVLLGTAIIAPGTFDLPSEFTPPDVSDIASTPITVSLDNPDPESDEPASTEEPVTSEASLDPIADTVLGTRFHDDPPVPVVVPTTSPTQTPEPPATPDPSPTDGPPVVTPPDVGGPIPGVGGPTPDPGTAIPDDVRGDKDKNKKPKKDKGAKDKNPNANGNGHAYGHDRGSEHPAEGVPPGHDDDGNHPGQGNAHGHDKNKDKGKDKGKGSGAAPVPGVTPAVTPEEDGLSDDDGGDA
jgi:hypothetical protein